MKDVGLQIKLRGAGAILSLSATLTSYSLVNGHMRCNHLPGAVKIMAVAVCMGSGLLYGMPDVPAQQLPIRRYGVTDGMPHSGVYCIHRDRKGYLWLGTAEGLSRFDGYRFVNYGVRDGLVPPFINAVVEDSVGRIWVATNGGGVARLLDDPREARALNDGHPPPSGYHKFITFPVGDTPDSNRVNAMLFDSRDNLWCATDAGLYRGAPDQNGNQKGNQNGNLSFSVVVAHENVTEHMPAFADSKGRMWFGIADQLVQVGQQGVIKYGPADEIGRGNIAGVAEDGQGRLLVATNAALFEFVDTAAPGGRGRWKKIPIALDRAGAIRSMMADSTGTLWVGTANGLIACNDGNQTLYTTAQGLSSNIIQALEDDVDGNLWIGTFAGACKMASHRIVSFTRNEGLPGQDVNSAFVDRDGRVYASCAGSGLAEVLEAGAAPVQGSEAQPFNNIDRRILQDRRGDWWIGTDRGLFRFQGPELQLRRGKRFSAADGISESKVSSIAEDPGGKIFAGSWDGNLYCYDAARNGPAVFERVPKAPIGFAPLGIACSSESLWLASINLLGILKSQQLTLLQPAQGLPEIHPRALFRDSRGWLWIGLRYGGVSVTTDPDAAHPHFLNYSVDDGLASDCVWSITEDHVGRMYFATGRDLDRLDLSTGTVRHFTTADGLAGDQLHQCVTDRQGNIWVATATGLSRINPRSEVVSRAPPVYIMRVQIAGEEVPLAETGIVTAPGLSLPASRNNILIEYLGLDFHGERTLRYQHKLEGVDSDWSPPGDQTSVIYARLAPGAYRFMVRAINQQGLESSEPASIPFRILPPVWQRWWFLAAALMIGAALVYGIHRYRVGRLLELERIRTRIATDLHDDIGSSLSRMAILSEVVKQRIEPSAAESRELLTEIADSGRRLVDAMSDIVWSIDPRRDDLSNLASRIREFSAGVLDMKPVKWTLNVAPELDALKLGPDQRRQVFLIFKEAITNAARHSECGTVGMSVTLSHNKLVAEIADDGCGFATELHSNGRGQGLESMKRRAAHLGGEMSIRSAPGRGTLLRLEVPVR